MQAVMSLCGVSIGVVFLEKYSDPMDVGAGDAEGGGNSYLPVLTANYSCRKKV